MAKGVKIDRNLYKIKKSFLQEAKHLNKKR